MNRPELARNEKPRSTEGDPDLCNLLKGCQHILRLYHCAGLQAERRCRSEERQRQSGRYFCLQMTFARFLSVLHWYRIPAQDSQSLKLRKILMSIKFPPVILGRKWLRQFYGRLAFWGSFCCKTPMPIKFLLLGGGSWFF